ncbi:hypothetical protein [Amycolatopsis sp. FDAARGOS 1241]|uniref:hypothetical protein n=1 Tax=Amycolatopsis sp. FDAARGOS 1241 TaxID=2778070 RepID=UPI00195051CB|nr:hypothetical protein [Amycolatopsis sp. FDAARGOS 1241]QRP45407.1 hypothetical protein I6J71_40715 [Amycolatopsis sp. FDAARGOS 1241]
MPPSRRQPPRSSTPQARRPRVAGLRKPSSADEAPASAERPTSPAKPRPRPVPRTGPLTGADPTEVTQEIRFPASVGISRSKGLAEETAPVEEAEEAPAEVDALTREVVEDPPAPASEDAADEAPVRPAPRRKHRDSGRAKPVDVEEAEQEAAGTPFPAAPWAAKKGQDRTVALTVVLLVVGLVFAAGAVIFKLQYDSVSDSTSNTALLDVAKTAQVKDQISKATEALFSYDYNNIKKTEDAAANLLANDDVKAKYNSLMGEVKRLAPQQKMVVTCKVSRSAVILLNGDLARVMVFVDQTSTRADTKQTTAGSAQLHVDAQLQGDTWKITDLDTYKAAPPPAAKAPAPSAPPSK